MMRRRLAPAAVAAILAVMGAVALPGVPGPGFAAPAATASPGECIVIDNFSRDPVGQFPQGWQVRKEDGRAVYSVQEEGPLRFLRAISRGLGIQAGRAHTWDLDAYPILAWRWRVEAFPHGGDERESRTNDSALAVYLLVPYSRLVGPKAVKYVWSERVPVGTRLDSNGGLTQVRILRSGPEDQGRWTEERVNVRDDFRRFFDTRDVPKPAGLAVLTDADDTRSTAAGDYADFRVCRK